MNFDEWWTEQSERFRAAMLKEDMRDVWEAATEAEREACAAVCDAKHKALSLRAYPPPRILLDLAMTIRERSNPDGTARTQNNGPGS